MKHTERMRRIILSSVSSGSMTFLHNVS